MTGITVGIFLQIVLMEFFSDPEGACGDDFGSDGRPVDFGSIEVGDQVFGNFFLGVVQVENR